MIWRKDKNKIGIENPELGNLKKLEIEKEGGFEGDRIHCGGM